MNERIPWTADQLAAGISNALAAHDIAAVGDMLTVLTVVDPKRAELIYQTLRVGVALAAPEVDA